MKHPQPRGVSSALARGHHHSAYAGDDVMRLSVGCEVGEAGGEDLPPAPARQVGKLRRLKQRDAATRAISVGVRDAIGVAQEIVGLLQAGAPNEGST